MQNDITLTAHGPAFHSCAWEWLSPQFITLIFHAAHPCDVICTAPLWTEPQLTHFITELKSATDTPPPLSWVRCCAGDRRWRCPVFMGQQRTNLVNGPTGGFSLTSSPTGKITERRRGLVGALFKVQVPVITILYDSKNQCSCSSGFGSTRLVLSCCFVAFLETGCLPL